MCVGYVLIDLRYRTCPAILLNQNYRIGVVWYLHMAGDNIWILG